MTQPAAARTLADQLTSLHAAILTQIPPGAAQTFDRAVELVERSGLARVAIGVGDRAPTFSLPGIDGRLVSLQELLATGPAVVAFYRGGWCPYCNLQLRALQATLPEIEARGARLVAISPQQPDESLSTAEKAELRFPVLSDTGLQTSRRYGLVHAVDAQTNAVLRDFGTDLTRVNGSASLELPMPAVYVIDKSGMITFAHVDADYRRRAEPRAIVDALQRLVGRS